MEDELEQGGFVPPREMPIMTQFPELLRPSKRAFETLPVVDSGSVAHKYIGTSVNLFVQEGFETTPPPPFEHSSMKPPRSPPTS